ncbi:MAG TPA: hypothetical protein VFE32_04840 [Puia sp.]|jgi:hypothetical protein|nr:hypothetical protein [Puia sp.]
MSGKSFYDLDYIIEINEHRLEQYTTAYQKVMERLTHILLIYSGITIFLIPLVEDGALFRIRSPVFVGFLLMFLGLLAASVAYTVKLIIPVRVVYLGFPRRYYDDSRSEYELTIKDKKIVNDLLKSSYITELQEALEVCERKLKIREALHSKAVIFALLSVLPYLICVGFHLSQGQDNKNPISKSEKMSNFIETYAVSKKEDDKQASNETPKQRGGLPGVDNSLIIVSHPIYRLETSSRSYTYDANGKKVYLK